MDSLYAVIENLKEAIRDHNIDPRKGLPEELYNFITDYFDKLK